MIHLGSCSGQPNLLASLSKDGELRLWDVPGEACLAVMQTDATSIVSFCSSCTSELP